MLKRLLALAVGLAVSAPSMATTFALNSADSTVVGHNMVVYSRAKDTLLDIGRQFDLGYNDIVEANPNVDPWLPGENTRVIIPSRFILPKAGQKGIVINIAELRLYYYPETKAGQTKTVITHPIGIGREGWGTPLGKAKITQKRKDPTWTPPESIRKEHLEKGDPLPKVVAAGPDNPLGAYAMRLSMPGYLLHGTNKPYGVGMRVSHGCIRLFPEDIQHLFNIAAVNTPVEIIYQPDKAGVRDGKLYLEVNKPHSDIDKRQGLNMTPMVAAILDAQDKLPADNDWAFTEKLVEAQDSIVKRVGEEPLDIVDDVWFVHAGLSQKAIQKTRQAMNSLQLNDLFWPAKSGAVGEMMIGPFNSQQEAADMANKISEAAGVSVWVAQVSSDAL